MGEDNEKGFFPHLSEEEMAAMPAPPPPTHELHSEDWIDDVYRTQPDGELVRLISDEEAAARVQAYVDGMGEWEIWLPAVLGLDGYEYAIVRRKKDGA